MREAEDDIRESLRVLFMTRPGERVMHPDFGCRLHDLVFEPMTARTADAMEVVVTRAIRFFEARVRLAHVRVHIIDAAAGRLEIEVGYTIRATNSRHNTVYPFYIDEGTLLSEAPRPGPAS